MSLPFLSTPPSCPCHFLVCPLHFPCMPRSFVASHFPTSLVVPIGFLVLCFPLIPPALPLFSFLFLSCPFQFPFVSLSCPLAFLSGRLPISSPHFLALPCISPLLPRISRKKHGFPSVFAKRTSNNTKCFHIFGKRRQETKPAKSRQGDSSLFCDTSPKTTFSGLSSNYRAVCGGPPHPPRAGFIPYPLLGIQHTSAMSADFFRALRARQWQI